MAKARASPTRCCMPPDSSCAYFFAHWSRSTSFSCWSTRCLALGIGHAGEFKAEADILLDGAPRQQAELLEHHGDVVLAQPPQASPRRRRRRRPSCRRRCTRTCPRDDVKAVDGAQQRGLAGAGKAHQHGDLALVDGEVGAGAAEHGPVFSRISVRVAPWSIMASAVARSAPKTISTFLKSTAAFISCLRADPARRSRMMASTTIASPASSPRSMLREPAPVDLGAETAGADQRGEHHHRQ